MKRSLDYLGAACLGGTLSAYYLFGWFCHSDYFWFCRIAS